jgi:hypothetical protein
MVLGVSKPPSAAAVMKAVPPRPPMPSLPAPAPATVKPACPVIQGTPAAPGIPNPKFPPTGPQPACNQPGSVPATGTATEASSNVASYAIAGVMGLVLLGAIGVKYTTHSNYTSFWGRILALVIAAASAFQAARSYAVFDENDCANASNEDSTSCPNSMDILALGCVTLFHLAINLPFIFAGKEREKKLYAQYSLNQQAVLTTGFCGSAAFGLKSTGGGLVATVLVGAGCLVGGLFTMGYFKGEDGALERLMETAGAMVGAVAESANAVLGVFGLDAAERSKVTEANIYLHARVKTGTKSGEVVGFVTETGSEGKVPAKGKGHATVLLDDPKKTEEFAIGELEFEDSADQQGVFDKVMGNMFGVFGGGEEETSTDRKRQVECFLVPPELRDDDDNIPVPKKGVLASAVVAFELTAFGEDMGVKTRVSGQEGGSKTGFKGAVRFKDVGNGTTAIIIELQKIPEDVQFLSLAAKAIGDGKLRDAAYFAGAVSVQGFGKVLNEVGNVHKKFMSHAANEAFLFFVFTRKKDTWYLVDKYQVPFTGGDEALTSFVSKVRGKREEKKFKEDNIDIFAKLIDLEVEKLAETNAKKKISEDIETLAEKFTAQLLKQGQPPAAAKAAGKTAAAEKFKALQMQRFEAVRKAKLVEYIKAGKKNEAVALAQAAAKKSLIFGDSEDKFMKEAREQVMAEEEKINEQRRKEAEEYNNSWSGVLFGSTEEPTDKKKKKKKPTN